MMSTANHSRTKTMVALALFTAIIVVLQMLGSFIHFGPFSISLVLVPIVIGTALYGPWAGAYLGAVFGLVVLLSGDAAMFLAINPLGAVITVMVKGTLCGLVAGLVYRMLEHVNKTFAVFAAAVICPVVNTGIFLICCKFFFMDWVVQMTTERGYANAAAFMFLFLAGGNFLFELLVNCILSPVIVRIIRLGKKAS